MLRNPLLTVLSALTSLISLWDPVILIWSSQQCHTFFRKRWISLPIRLLVHHMWSYLPPLFSFLITTILFNNHKIFELILVGWKMISKMIAIGLRHYGNFLFWYFHFFLTCSPLYKLLPNTFILKLGTLLLFVLDFKKAIVSKGQEIQPDDYTIYLKIY